MEENISVGDRVKFDYMGQEHRGVVTEVTASSGLRLSHDVFRVKSDNHVSHVVINATLFPSRIRKDDRKYS